MISSARPLRGFTRAELVVVVVILVVLALVAVPNYWEKQSKVYIGRIRSDHRTLGTALEYYFADHGSYPASTTNFADQVDRAAYRKPPKVFGSTFRSHAPGLATLTTPVAYITSYFADPAASTKGITFRYHSDGKGWILGSWGPDFDEESGGQLLWDGGIERIYDSSRPEPEPLYLLEGTGPRGAYSYNPTNGAISAGDVWRVRQPLRRKPGT